MTSRLHAVPNQFPFATDCADIASKFSLAATLGIDPLQHEIASQFDSLYPSSVCQREISEW